MGNVALYYAYMQLDYMKNNDQLLALGCHDWRLEKLIEDMDPFFTELPSVLQGAHNPLTHEEQEMLQSIVPRLKTFCVELLQLGVPSSLTPRRLPSWQHPCQREGMYLA